MVDQNVSLLFRMLRDDIKELKADVTTVLEKHEKELEDLKSFKWKWLGAIVAVSVIFQAAAKLIEIAAK